MPAHAKADLKWVNRIITIVFFSIIIYCSYQSWHRLEMITRAIVCSYLNININIAETNDASDSSIKKHDAFPIYYAKRETPPATHVAWPRIDVLEKVQSRIKNYHKQAKDYNNDIRRSFLEVNSFIQDILLVDAIYQKHFFIKDTRGYVYLFKGQSLLDSRESESLERFVQHIKEVKAEADKINAPILICYSLMKPTSSQYIKQSWLGALTSPNSNHEKIEELLSPLTEHLSIKKSMLRDGYNPHDYLFKTDHHWTTEAGFYAYTKIAEHYRDRHQVLAPEQYLDKANFHHDIIRKRFFGSLNRFVGQYWAGLEDITLIYPKFETEIEFILPFSDFRRKGEFKHALFDMAELEVESPYDSGLYTIYLGGEHPLDITINKQAANPKKILIIRDSFASVVSPYLSLIFEEVHQIDPRLYPDDILEYIRMNKLDFILYLYSPNYGAAIGKNRM